MAGRPEVPPSYVVDLNKVVDQIHSMVKANPKSNTLWDRMDIDVVIPVYESLPEGTASRIMWITDCKIYMSIKSRFVEYLTVERGKDRFYIYDKFKANSYSHKNSYKQLTYEVPYVDDTAEPIYIPMYWRVN